MGLPYVQLYHRLPRHTQGGIRRHRAASIVCGECCTGLPMIIPHCWQESGGGVTVSSGLKLFLNEMKELPSRLAFAQSRPFVTVDLAFIDAQAVDGGAPAEDGTDVDKTECASPASDPSPPPPPRAIAALFVLQTGEWPLPEGAGLQYAHSVFGYNHSYCYCCLVGVCGVSSSVAGPTGGGAPASPRASETRSTDAQGGRCSQHCLQQ